MQVELKPAAKQVNSGERYFANNLPKLINDIDFIVLSFGYNNRLFRIEAFSRSFDSDPYGYAVVTRYKELAALLSKRYGYGKDTDTRDTELWKNDDEYVMSLYQGRAFRLTRFKTTCIEVDLHIAAEGQDKAFIGLTFTNLEEFAQFECSKRNRELDAL